MRSYGYERLLVLALFSGCVCKKKGPPVLFHSDVPGAPTVAADGAPPADGPAADVPRFAAVEAAPVEGDGASLAVDGATVAAPPGERFVRWLRVDLDGDGQATDVALARVGGDGTARAPALYRRVGGGFEPAPLPGADPTDPRCAESTLRLTSPRSLVVSWRCPPGAAPAGEAPVAEEQLLVGLSATPGARERASLLAGALPGTALELRVEGADLDGDGRDEVALGVAAGVAGAPPRASARVTFFERAGALARDTAEPAASLNANLAAARQALTRGRAGAVDALAILDDYLRLRRAFCAESGLAKLRAARSTGFDCGGAPPTPAAELYARTLVNLGELPAAEAQLAAETATDLGPVTSERVLADVERAALVDRTVTARPGPFAGASLDALAPARAGVLAFDRANAPTAVALRGPAGGTVDLRTLTFTPGPAGSVADVMVRSPEGAFAATGFVENCAGVAIVRCRTTSPECAGVPVTASATALPPGAEAVALPALPSLATARRCQQDPAAVQGLGATVARAGGWGAGGLVVAVRGVLYRAPPEGPARAVLLGEALGAGFAPGSAANAGGTAALAGRSGVWVRERTAWRRWSPAALAGRFAQLTDLTVSGDGRAVAALAGTQLWVLERPRAPARR